MECLQIAYLFPSGDRDNGFHLLSNLDLGPVPGEVRGPVYRDIVIRKGEQDATQIWNRRVFRSQRHRRVGRLRDRRIVRSSTDFHAEMSRQCEHGGRAQRVRLEERRQDGRRQLVVLDFLLSAPF